MARDFERSGLDAGTKYGDNLAKGLRRSSPQVEKAMDRVADATGRVKIEQQKYDDMIRRGETNRTKLITQAERTSAAYRKLERATRDTAREQDEFDRAVRRSGDSLTVVVGQLNRVGLATRGVGRGLATIAAPVALKGLLDFAKVATTATQSLYLLPAAATAAGAGIGTLALATSGFGDAIKEVRDPEKFAEALALLSPNAQQAALSIQALLPEIDKLRHATSDAFSAGFGGRGGILEQLSAQYLPSVQGLTTSIAGSFNQMFQDITNQLQTAGTQGQIQTTMDNIAAAFRNLTPAADSLVQAFIDMTEVGSDFLPDLASGAADLAHEFAAFIREARQSGDLKRWIREGLDAVKELTQAVVDIGQIIFRVFGSDGKKNVEDFRDTLGGINTVLDTLTGNFDTFSIDIQEEFAAMTGPAAAFRDLILDIPEAFQTMGNAVIEVVQRVSNLMDTLLINPFRQLFKGLNAIAPKLGMAADLPVIPEPPTYPKFGVGDFAPYTPPVLPGRGTRPGGPPSRRRLGPPPPGGAYPVPGPPPAAGTPTNIPREQYAIENIPIGQFPGAQFTPPGMGALAGAGATYGLPGGTRITQGAAGFPEWVYALGAQYGLTPSTYPGHQESNRGDIGALPNPMGLNRGIDWWGSPENMQAFADALVAGGLAEQVIFENPQTGQQTGFPFGVDYSGNFPGHRKHVHTRFGAAPMGMGGPMSMAGMGDGVGQGPGYYQVDPQKVWDAESKLFSQQHRVEETRARLLELRADNTASEQDKLKAQNDVIEAERQYISDQQDLAEAQQGSFEKLDTSTKTLSDGMGQIGATLDADFGISKGLPGLAENLTKFLANLAAAPLLGQLGAMQQLGQAAHPEIQGGGGLLGMLGAQNIHRTGSPLGIQGGLAGLAGMGGQGGGLGGLAAMGANWEAIAQKESGGNWGITYGQGAPDNPVTGGLQIGDKTWADYGGLQYGVPHAYMAPKEAQIAVAENILRGQGPGAWPNTFVPWGGQRGGRVPGTGRGDKVPALLEPGEFVLSRAMMGYQAGGPVPRIGGVAPSAHGSPGGAGLGGLPMEALMAAASMLPGGGIGASIAIKEITRAIEYGGELASIGVSGLLETFLPAGSELATNSWVARIASGLAGAAPALPSVAGQLTQQMGMMGGQGGQPPGPLTPAQVQAGIGTPASGIGTGPAPGPITVNYTNNQATEDRAGADLTHHLTNMHMGPGR